MTQNNQLLKFLIIRRFIAHLLVLKYLQKIIEINDELEGTDNGNMYSGAGRIITYDYDNRPSRIVYGSYTTDFVYDAYGNRVKKIVNAGTGPIPTIYVSQLYEFTSTVRTRYIFAGSQRIAKLDTGVINGLDYYHTDHLGSSSIITNSAGNKVQDIYYYPFGEIKFNLLSDVTNYKFTGQEWDAEYGLYYYGARYYDPKLARFISADTIVPNPRDPQALNRYSYVLNNPLLYIDPSGHGGEEKGTGYFLSSCNKKLSKRQDYINRRQWTSQ